MTDDKKIAGGRATEAGMGFQAAVTAWFAARLLSNSSIGSQFGLSSETRILGLQCETRDPMDDIVIQLQGKTEIYVQCKTHPSLGQSSNSEIASVIKQLVELFFSKGQDYFALTGSVALLAIAEDAPSTLNKLELACRMFDSGGQWNDVLNDLPDDQSSALQIFEKHARHFWNSCSPVPMTSDDLVSLARIFRIRRFGIDATSSDWRETSQTLGRGLYGGDEKGEGPLASLIELSRKFMRTGAPIERAGLLQLMHAKGHFDTKAPGFEKDIEKLLVYSRNERERLKKHTTLPLANGIPIERDCLKMLLQATQEGSLLVTGEPGAGKTGILLNLASLLDTHPGPTVFLSVERFSEINKRRDLQTELNLDHDLVDILSAWPGMEPGVLIIDALDASRGNPSEPVIADLISDAVSKIGSRWSIVASIRSFDLKNGYRFREIMSGKPPFTAFSEPQTDNVRHFKVHRLTEMELQKVSSASPQLMELVSAAPKALMELLANIYNLSLAVELLAAGTDASEIQSVDTQSELIRRYEDIRLPTHALKIAVKSTIEAMVKRRQLTVRAVEIQSSALDDLIQSGVLVTAGDRVAFAHHVLFDHIAGRFYLDWDNVKELRQQLSTDHAIGLLLGPALRFCMEHVWTKDPAGKGETWRFLLDLAKTPNFDPIVMSIALRTAGERVKTLADVDELCRLIRDVDNSFAIGKLLPHLARFVGMTLAELKALLDSAAIAWASVALAASEAADRKFSDSAKVLLLALSEKSNFNDVSFLEIFGQAARNLLRNAWAQDEDSFLATSAIRLVARSYSSNIESSRVLLSRILNDRFEEHASQEANWLAEGVRWIIPHDPQFVVIIFATLFQREVTDESKTWMGGSASRILPLTSTHRQDYQMARWQLNKSMKSFLISNPMEATAAVIVAVKGIWAADRHQPIPAPTEIDTGQNIVQVFDDHLSWQEWRNEKNRDEPPLPTYVEFLKTCSNEAFRDSIQTAIELPANAAIWARILGIAATRLGIADDLLWPIATQPEFAALSGLSRDAVIYLAAVYPDKSTESRKSFERSALAKILTESEREANWWKNVLSRFFSILDPKLIATPEMTTLRNEMQMAGDISGNAPHMSMSVGWGTNEDIVDGILRNSGADLENSPDREIRAASRILEEFLKSNSAALSSADVTTLWDSVESVIEVLDASDKERSHGQLIQAAWGAVSNGVERLAKCETYDPALATHPDIETLLTLIDRLLQSPFPESSDTESDQMGWGNWDVRVYAASSLVEMAGRFPSHALEVSKKLSSILRDPAPTVRLQVVQVLGKLYDAAPTEMWELVDEIAANENHAGVLAFFISGPIRYLAQIDPGRCSRLISAVLERSWSPTSIVVRKNRNQLYEAAASVVAYLYVVHNDPGAWSWIERWTEDSVQGEQFISAMLHDLREVFFFPYRKQQTDERLALASRAKRILELTLVAAAANVEGAREKLANKPTPEIIAEWRPRYESADHIVDQVCNQLYFGAGAFRTQNHDELPGLLDRNAKCQFLADYSAVLDLIAKSAQSRTVHHLLELLEYLVEGDPIAVFDRITKTLLGPAAADGYQYESMALDTLAKLVRRYLADHRDIFENQDRRQKLIEVLELFASVGWPDALKLLFELPDLLR